jgi:sorting nexin-9/18/33
MYSVTSMFSPPSTHITVHRRFSQFAFLHAALSRRLPGIAIPPLPEKQYTGRFNDDFVEARRGDLERWLGGVVRHPLARYAEVVTFFLGCEDDIVSFRSRVKASPV